MAKLGEAVRKLRESRDWSQSDLARQVGTNRQSISQLEQGEIGTPRYLPKLAAAFGVDPLRLQAGEIAPAARTVSPVREFAPLEGSQSMPVYGQAEGGPDGVFTMNGQAVDHVARPASLATVPTAYAVYMHGDSMSPRYEAGETLYIHPGRPITSGSYVVFQVQLDEHEPLRAFVKQFLRRDGKDYVFRQLNPDMEIRWPVAKVATLHKIVLAGDD